MENHEQQHKEFRANGFSDSENVQPKQLDCGCPDESHHKYQGHKDGFTIEHQPKLNWREEFYKIIDFHGTVEDINGELKLPSKIVAEVEKLAYERGRMLGIHQGISECEPEFKATADDARSSLKAELVEASRELIRDCDNLDYLQAIKDYVNIIKSA